MIDILASLDVPGPTVTEITQPFWNAARDGRLRLLRCHSCRRFIFYPRKLCPHCWSNKLDWVDASGKGTLKSFSIVYRPGHPGWLPAVPYVVGLVALAEGPTMLSLILVPAPEAAIIGMPLQVRFTRVGKAVLPLFEETAAFAMRRTATDTTEGTDG